MIEDSFSYDATLADVQAYLERRVAHLVEINKRLVKTQKDIARAEKRIVQLSAVPKEGTNAPELPATVASCGHPVDRRAPAHA